MIPPIKIIIKGYIKNPYFAFLIFLYINNIRIPSSPKEKAPIKLITLIKFFVPAKNRIKGENTAILHEKTFGSLKS